MRLRGSTLKHTADKIGSQVPQKDVTMFSKYSKIEPTHNGAYLMSPIFLDVKEPSVENADDVFCPTFFSVWFVFW